MRQKWDSCIDCGVEKKKTCAMRCRPCANKNAWRSALVKERVSLAVKAKHCDPDFKTKHAEAVRNAMNDPLIKARHAEAMSAANKHSQNKPEIRIKKSIARGGDGNIERIDRWKRGVDRYKQSDIYRWSVSVKCRDGNRCQHCGVTSQLHAHHIKQRSMFPELALDISNGITLCKTCHVSEHQRMKGL
jgi:hypothetical protein